MSEDIVRYEVDGAVATITLNRPDRLNAMNQDLLVGALDALERANDDDAVRAVIFTGAGKGFCVGGDLQGFTSTGAAGLGADDKPAKPPTLAGSINRLRAWMRSSELLHEMPKVTIAAINGACAGAGMSWASACDLRYAARSAKFNTAFLNAGLSGDFGGTWTLPRIVGPAKARELYLLAEKFGADDAERIGYVTRTVDDGDLIKVVREVADKVAASAPLTVRAIKANLNDSLEMSFSDLMNREAERHQRCGTTRDSREAARAFLEKRPPVFEGR